MITYSKVKENIINGFRSIKVLQYGAKTADVASPFGDDSAPLKDMIAIYSDTSNASESVVIGYLNKNQIATTGEKRIFSLKPDGTLSIDIHLRTDGTLEIAGANDNAVRYTPLDAGIVAKDALINAELAKIATAISTLGGTYAVGNISTDITAARVDEVKLL